MHLQQPSQWEDRSQGERAAWIEEALTRAGASTDAPLKPACGTDEAGRTIF
jgi:hypothetical protein